MSRSVPHFGHACNGRSGRPAPSPLCTPTTAAVSEFRITVVENDLAGATFTLVVSGLDGVDTVGERVDRTVDRRIIPTDRLYARHEIPSVR